MLSGLRIRGFKAWEDTGELELAPITVFFGTNSSGKSSLSQALLMLRQTSESPDRRRVIHFGDRNTLVDLGTFEEMAFQHDIDKPVRLSFSWDLPEQMVVEDSRSDARASGDSMAFDVTVAQVRPLPGRVRVEEFSYALIDAGRVSMRAGMRREESRSRYELGTEGFHAVRVQGRPWELPEPVRFYGFPDEAVAYYQNTGFLPDFALAMERALGRISYLGPLRERPSRTYIWSGEIPEHVGWAGERVVDAILAAKDRSISGGYRQRYRPFDEVIARWLLQMGLIAGFRVEPIARGRKEYEVRVRVEPRGTEVTLPDVGFGVSQVLPVLVQSFYAPRHSTLILEQPEIHLHPSVQATLADLFVEAVSSREGGKDRDLQLIVESHSEHFLRRLQRLIAEEKVDPQDVAIYFCTDSSSGAKIERLELDLFGRILNWPKAFFGDVAGDLQAQAESVLARSKENSG